MESTEKIKYLEEEILKLKNSVAKTIIIIKDIETFVNDIKNNTNPDPVNSTKVSTVSDDNNNNKTVPKPVLNNTNNTKSNKEHSISENSNNNSEVSKKPVLNNTNNTISENSNNNTEVSKKPVLNNTDNKKLDKAHHTKSKNNNNKSTVSKPALSNSSHTRPNNANHQNSKNTPSVKNNISTNDQNKKLVKPTEDANLESWIGKVFMGAIASLLVFISLFTFTKVLLPFLTDTMKITSMFVVSTILTVTGFVFSKKKPENTFFKALLACGSACIYLSILMTGIHFKAISSIVMYILIAFWAVLIIFLKKDKDDWLFFAVGNLGYFVSIIFTMDLNDKSLIIPLLIYAIMISVVYQLIYWKNKPQRHIQTFINIMSLLIFQNIMISTFQKIAEVKIVGIVASIFAFVGFTVYLLSFILKYIEEHFYIVTAYVYFMVYFKLLYSSIFDYKSQFMTSFIGTIIPAIVIEFVIMYLRRKNLAKNEHTKIAVFSGFLFFKAVSVIFKQRNVLFHTGIILVAYSLIIIYGIIKKDSFFKKQGWVLVYLCIFLDRCQNRKFDNPLFTFVATILILSSFIVEGIILNDSELFKTISYFAVLERTTRIINQVFAMKLTTYDSETIKIITYGIIALLNVVMILTKFYNTKNILFSNIHVVLDTINLVLMAFGAYMMNLLDDNTLKISYMIIVFVLAFINLPVNDKKSVERYMYTAIKIAILVFYSLHVFETPSYTISIYMIALAVVYIVIGFRDRLMGKELRIFGLVMTLLFVLKFISLDIIYDNSVLKALSYLISGMLCFGISAIYNYFDKKQGNKYNPKLE